MTAAAVIGAIAWGGLAVLVAIAVGRTIAERDRRERPDCCPHDESEAGPTVRGEFRSVVTR